MYLEHSRGVICLKCSRQLSWR